MTALTSPLPRKSSRTSTQAVIVPSTALTTETTTAAARLSSSAATASGAVATDQNWCSPFSREAQTRAAIGSTTTTDRNAVVKPSERAAPAAPSLERRARSANAGLARRRPSDGTLDRDHPALVRVEPDLVGVAPAADDLVVDLEDAGPCRV